MEGIVNAIPKYYPELKIPIPEKKHIWHGYRPCSPDGLPYLGFAKNIKNLLIAGGHGMMGISLGAATGKVIAELANGESPSLDIGLYDPLRFG